MDPNEYYEFEDRAYVSPTVSRDEQLGFVNTLRDTVDANTAQINAQTQHLGTDITPNYGGLTGSDGYFAQRYQTTPVEAQVNTLKATAQAKALNDLMTNYESQAKNRYNQAYRRYQRRAHTPTTTTTDPDDGEGLPPNVEATTPKGGNTAEGGLEVDLSVPGTSIVNDEGWAVKYDSEGHMIQAEAGSPYRKSDNGYYYDVRGISVPFQLEFRFASEADRDTWKANEAARQKGDKVPVRIQGGGRQW